RERRRDDAELRVEEGAGEVGPGLYVGRVGAAAQRDRHLLGRGQQGVADDLEGDRVESGGQAVTRCPERASEGRRLRRRSQGRRRPAWAARLASPPPPAQRAPGTRRGPGRGDGAARGRGLSAPRPRWRYGLARPADQALGKRPWKSRTATASGRIAIRVQRGKVCRCRTRNCWPPSSPR